MRTLICQRPSFFILCRHADHEVAGVTDLKFPLSNSEGSAANAVLMGSSHVEVLGFESGPTWGATWDPVPEALMLHATVS